MNPPEAITASALGDLIRARILTDEEIAEEITKMPLQAEDLPHILTCLVLVKGSDVEITGPIRTAIRAVRGLPPIAGD